MHAPPTQNLHHRSSKPTHGAYSGWSASLRIATPSSYCSLVTKPAHTQFRRCMRFTLALDVIVPATISGEESWRSTGTNQWQTEQWQISSRPFCTAAYCHSRNVPEDVRGAAPPLVHFVKSDSPIPITIHQSNSSLSLILAQVHPL